MSVAARSRIYFSSTIMVAALIVLISITLVIGTTKAVVYSPLSNCTSACSQADHQCNSCAEFADACPEDLVSSSPPALDLDPTTCYQTDCSSGGCPDGEEEDPEHSPGEICFSADLGKCHSMVCRYDRLPCRYVHAYQYGKQTCSLSFYLPIHPI